MQSTSRNIQLPMSTSEHNELFESSGFPIPEKPHFCSEMLNCQLLVPPVSKWNTEAGFPGDLLCLQNACEILVLCRLHWRKLTLQLICCEKGSKAILQRHNRTPKPARDAGHHKPAEERGSRERVIHKIAGQEIWRCVTELEEQQKMVYMKRLKNLWGIPYYAPKTGYNWHAAVKDTLFTAALQHFRANPRKKEVLHRNTPPDILHDESNPALGGIVVPTCPCLSWHILVDGRVQLGQVLLPWDWEWQVLECLHCCRNLEIPKRKKSVCVMELRPDLPHLFSLLRFCLS